MIFKPLELSYISRRENNGKTTLRLLFCLRWTPIALEGQLQFLRYLALRTISSSTLAFLLPYRVGAGA